MTINWWTLGLQAVNVLILVWLLSRLFWKPIAAAIATRQETARALLTDGETARAKADAALADVTKTRGGMAAERVALLAEARTQADTAMKAAAADAREEADKLLTAAKLRVSQDDANVLARTEADSAELAVVIARKLLERLDTVDVQTAFLKLLIEAIEAMSPQARERLAASADGIDLDGPGDMKDEDRAKTTEAVRKAIGGKPVLNFVRDPDLIAGFELRTAHFALHNSWQWDLGHILRDLKHAG